MKRYIKSSIEYDYPIDIDSRYEIDEADLDAKIREILEPAAEFISHVDVHLGSLSINDIRVFSNLGIKQLRVTSPNKQLSGAISMLLRKLKTAIPAFIQDNKTKQEAKQSGNRMISAMSVVIQLIKQKFGYKPTFTYSDTGKIQYHLWSLPFVDPDNKFKLKSEIDAAADELDEFCKYIESTYDIDMTWGLPTGGSWVYAAWEIVVPRNNGYFIFDKDTKEYRRV